MLIQQTGKGLNGNLGYASAISVVLFLLTIGPLLVVGYINQGAEIREARKLRKKSMATTRQNATAPVSSQTAAPTIDVKLSENRG